jgi:importin-7
MKNRVSHAWSKSSAESYNTNPIPKTEKDTFRPLLIQVLIVATPAIRSQFMAILSKVLTADYPSEWPEFYDVMHNLLQSGEINQVYAGLTCFHELCKVFRWKSGENRAGLQNVVQNVFPVALQIANKLFLDSSVESGTMLVLILKAYKSAIAVSSRLEVV